MKYAKCVPRACATKMYECSSCKQERTSIVRANKRCTRAVYANHDAHGSTPTSRVYMRALMCIVTSLIFHSQAGFFACIFMNVSSRVVAARVSSQVYIELYRTISPCFSMQVMAVAK